MGVDTNARQNMIIWSATGGLILILLGVIGWFANAKDSAVLTSINEIKNYQMKYMEKMDTSDRKILDAVQVVCERLGGIEGRVGNLEIQIQLPFAQRKPLYEKYRIWLDKQSKK